MKKIRTLFTASKAKQLLRDNLDIKGKQRGNFIIEEDTIHVGRDLGIGEVNYHWLKSVACGVTHTVRVD